MKIINERPPNWDKLSTVFDIHGGGAVFTYGNVIYNPDGAYLEPDLIEHEMIHMEQQKLIGTDEWWRRFTSDPAFRLAQEIPAYHRQYSVYCVSDKDKNSRFNFLHALALNLSSGLYADMIPYSKALIAIKNGELPVEEN